MNNASTSSRRQFAVGTVGGLIGLGIAAISGRPVLAADVKATKPEESANFPGRGHIYKSVKWGMIEGDLTVLEKFQLCKELGYDGMELNSPEDVTAQEIQAASAKTGMPVHGLVNSKHWEIRLSSPDANQREQGVVILCQAIRDSKAFGGDTVLLVPGRVDGDEENHDHVWQRSIVAIRKVLPLASQLGVRVLIENVWNGFCESPEQLRDYLDEIDSPWVGSYFDIGNAQKFAPSQKWIRTLGHRIVKLDVKGWGVGLPNRGFCKIGDGSVDWLEVRKSLADIGFAGWCTAEVKGGDRARLADVATRVDRVMQL